MQLNKTAGMQAGKTADSLAKNIAVKNAAQAAQTKTIETQVPRSIASLISASGLPQDKLSSSVLSFARFFSLALKPEQLTAIRRQAFTPPNNTDSAKQINFGREIFSLAAAAAESKGVELQPKGLEAYAEAVDPDQNKKQDGENRGKERRKKEQKEQEEKNAISAVNVKKLALESADNNPVLQIMNKLPGKNNQRWIVIPFEFDQDDKEYRVSMRILLERESAVFMAIDIAMSNEQGAVSSEKREESKYSFGLEFTNNRVSRLIYYTKEKVKKEVKKEIASIFDLNTENVFVKSGEDGGNNIPEADYGEELLRFINEAV